LQFSPSAQHKSGAKYPILSLEKFAYFSKVPRYIF
jgi:hypothetical protein